MSNNDWSILPIRTEKHESTFILLASLYLPSLSWSIRSGPYYRRSADRLEYIYLSLVVLTTPSIFSTALNHLFHLSTHLSPSGSFNPPLK
ncbi:uncharacterized protein K444DRAFT_694089 [Hyaloscypha bicolor E]|uniref:Uncharacterized protein n=1 Tax=Hyaloscypha bicolor E TaxID=1095630 RepID=A0A2J6T0E7_9HELO|nr:uncharacterized protein K444DRAFT_694089 [Hyaloscypha bicolor E]PMD56518.1 hypothetical protein K444DRAFT_694089 [Hyaloscypha bicolor E]